MRATCKKHSRQAAMTCTQYLNGNAKKGLRLDIQTV